MKKQKAFDIIHEDEFLVFVNKSAELLSVPDRYDPEIPNLQQELSKIYPEIFTVHRLDKGTSGIMVFTKDADTHRELSILFQENEVEKIYHAIVDGRFPDDPIEIDIPIINDPQKKGRSIPSARGKASLTKAKVIENYNKSALIKCMLVTGRHHQLRVHVASIGHPLLVDEMYGMRNEFFVSEIKKNFNLKKKTEEMPIISRQTMHAFSLKFIHPMTKKEIEIEAQYPKDFKALIQILGKYSPAKF